MTDQISYMDTAAATDVGVDYKRRSVVGLDLHPGQIVLDVGCGPGTDLGRLADAVGPGGSVIGVDRDPLMLAEARRRHAATAGVEVRAGDIHDLPFADASVDRARADRMLQHVRDPQSAVGEVRRVLRPGGLFGTAEPDWDTLAVADDDVATSRAFARFVAGRVRNATIGRELPRLCVRAGFRVRSVEPIPVLFRDFGTADRILGLRRNTDRAVEAGVLLDAVAAAWLGRLAAGPVVAGFTVYLVVAVAQ
ncbi:methyltransferase domain-containing protein [Actinoplanes sp. KI2]|uniref:methyltransferase domain-containing protein n=1 Tax=Actinoplanes sp. KI2 TaxID=2983315 RepID=UPI0021D5A6DD|nr:methyltransferase domain-containing protein [Actinoplanes sp. KI2]MCU7722208.1 methyltransferase domain-containing protein [Actinoplanes sp. KI2]